MRRSGVGSGGGYGSNKQVDSRAPKIEPRAHARNPAAVAQYGQLQGSHVTRGGESGYRGDPDYVRRGYQPPVGPTDNVAACGVGGGRKVYASGSQGVQGATNPGNPRPVGQDIFRKYDYPPVSRRPGNPGRSDIDADES
jgi:hypothetical protein